jgi:hypothetical protein
MVVTDMEREDREGEALSQARLGGNGKSAVAPLKPAGVRDRVTA